MTFDHFDCEKTYLSEKVCEILPRNVNFPTHIEFSLNKKTNSKNYLRVYLV